MISSRNFTCSYCDSLFENHARMVEHQRRVKFHLFAVRSGMNNINTNTQDDAEEELTSVQNLDEQYADDDTVMEEAAGNNN